MGTAIAVLATAAIGMFSGVDFSFLGLFLFIALTILVVLGLLNAFFFKSAIFDLARAYA